MHAVINHLPIKSDADWSVLAAKVDAFNASIRHPDFRGISMIRVSDNNEAIVVVMFSNRTSLDEVSKNVAGPWFAENMKQHLSGPASRAVGEFVAGAFKS